MRSHFVLLFTRSAYYCRHILLLFRTYTRRAALRVIDSFTTILMAHALYMYTVIDFGEPLKLTQVIWSVPL